MIPRQRQPIADDDGKPYPDSVLTDAIFGDVEAFGTLWAAHRSAVYQFVLWRVRDRHLAEDITSETSLRALRNINNFTPYAHGGGIVGWLITIARNLIADHFKSSRHRLETTVKEWSDADRPFLMAAVPINCEESAMADLTSQTIRSAIDRLNPLQRACVVARFIDQLSIAETAELLERDEGAVKTLQYRAVRTLARDGRLTPEMLT